MFVRNKIPRYSSCPTPSPSAAPKATHTAEPVVPFYLRKVSTPSASTLHTSSPSQSHHRHAKPPSTRPVTYPRTPPTKRRTAVMAAVTESIKVVLMRLNCRRYCRPPPPPRPLLHPFFADLPVTPFNPPIPHLVYRVYLLSLSLSFLAVDIPLLFPCDGFSFSPLHTQPSAASSFSVSRKSFPFPIGLSFSRSWTLSFSTARTGGCSPLCRDIVREWTLSFLYILHRDLSSPFRTPLLDLAHLRRFFLLRGGSALLSFPIILDLLTTISLVRIYYILFFL